MPEISPFGWSHTIAGIIAIISALFTLAKFNVIEPSNRSAQVYLLCTLYAAASALFIFRHGTVNPAHVLAILTLLALLAGTVAARTRILGAFSPYAQAISYSATLLFHMIPAITDGLMRLPVNDPIVKNIEDPLLKQFYLAFLVTYLIGTALQILWLRKRAPTSTLAAS